ncbi:MAG TPA: hypothetical protein VNH46_11825, partial [Gemmatimonadales bacterium]|nr:hypothetical protein [Gemmatimonadales bacterium]
MLGLLPAGAVLLVLQVPVQDQPSPRAILDSAAVAVEHGPGPVRDRWRRAARDPRRPDALLGLATLERLEFRQRQADSLYQVLQRRAG